MKEYICPECGCKRFWRMRMLELLVDFGREGAIKGHPMLEGPEREFTKSIFRCAECEVIITGDMARDMEAQII